MEAASSELLEFLGLHVITYEMHALLRPMKHSLCATVSTTIFESLLAPDLQPSYQGRGRERSPAVQLNVSSAINKWRINMSNSEI